MSSSPTTVPVGAPLEEASRLMHQHHFRQLPVLDESSCLVGMITDRDIRVTVGFGRPFRENVIVADVMTPNPITISSTASLDEAIALLVKQEFGALPIVDADRLVGIITYVDVLRALAHAFGFDHPGSRIEVALSKGFTDVARVFQALSGCSSELLAVVVSRTRGPGSAPALYLRVNREHAKDVEERLRKAGIDIRNSNHQGAL